MFSGSVAKWKTGVLDSLPVLSTVLSEVENPGIDASGVFIDNAKNIIAV